MSIRFPVELSIKPANDSTSSSLARLSHGELLQGRVVRVDSTGTASIRFQGFEAQSTAGSHLHAGKQVFASVQKTGDDTVLALLPTIAEGDIMTGTAVSVSRPDGLARFGRSELKVRLPHPDSSMPPAGTPLRVQVQLVAGRPILLLLPQEIPTTASASAAESKDSGMVPDSLERILAEPQYARLLDALLFGKIGLDGISRELLMLLEQLLIGKGETGRSAWAPMLTEALKTILLSPREGSFYEQLESAIRDSGIFLESRLLQSALPGQTQSSIGSDLKLALLLAHQDLGREAGPQAATGAESQSYLPDITAKVGQLLNGISAEQLLNLRLLPSDELYIQLPFAEGADLDRVQIRISHRGKRAAKKLDPRNVLIALVVTTSKLGRIRASLSIVDGQVNCQFRASRKPVVELFANSSDVLRRGLEKLNYRVANIGCMICTEENDFSIIDESVAASRTGLDVRA